MSVEKQIDCLEFKRIALADPHNQEHSFVEHSEHCPECLKYVGSVRKIDSDLADSLNTVVPHALLEKLKLNQELAETEMQESRLRSFWAQPRALAASLVAAMVVSIAMFSNQFLPSAQVSADYQQLVSAVMEHMDEVPNTEVWGADQANSSVNTLLASYDGALQLEYLDNLSFGRICPMGQYRGLHATLETEEGKITFAYLKGEPLSDVTDLSIDGYMSRVKPVRGGNIVIVSPTQAGLETASEQLTQAVYWDIQTKVGENAQLAELKKER